jgi:hypothetical protein
VPDRDQPGRLLAGLVAFLQGVGTPARGPAPTQPPAPAAVEPVLEFEEEARLCQDAWREADQNAVRLAAEQASRRRLFRRAASLGALLLGAAVGLSALLGPPATDARGSLTADRVAAVEREWRAGRHVLGFVGPANTLEFVHGVTLDDKDRDAQTTRAVRDALARGDAAAARKAFTDAQRLYAGSFLVAPTLSPPLEDALRRRGADFFRLYLFDCCAEDADVAEVRVNGVCFARVVLSKAGCLLSVPLPAGGARVEVVGVKDGRDGGVTVGVRTSRGDHLLRALPEFPDPAAVLDLGLQTPAAAGGP